MNKIISTTGESIEFTLNAEKNVLIDSVTPIEVTDEELAFIQERLGSQVSIVTDEVEETTATTVDDGINQSPEKVEAPALKNYKVLDEQGISTPDGIAAKDAIVALDPLDENTISLLTAGAIEEEIPQA